MTLHLQSDWILAVLLASIRMTALLMFTPLLGGSNAPMQARVVLLLGLTATMLSALPGGMPTVPNSVVGIMAAAAVELVIGAAMGFGLHCAFATFSFAGKLLDLQIGFSVGSVFDPVTRAASPLLGSLLTMLATALFYAADGHHMLMRVVAYSFEKLPPGGGLPVQPITPLVDQFGAMFVLGLTLAAPVVIALFLIDVGLGIVSRTVPQMNVFLIGIIVKVGAGLLLLMATLVTMAPAMQRVFANAFSYWQRLLN
jgi:flagellar biosynthetic protein FliR